MARSRNIKPGFFTNEDLVELDFATRLLFAGLWTVADKEGRLQDRPKKIKIDVFPADNLDIEAMLQALHDRKFITRYEVNGGKFIQIANWTKHQNPHHTEKASEIPGIDGELTVKPTLKPRESQQQDGGNLADSLIPDSLIPDSLQETQPTVVGALPAEDTPGLSLVPPKPKGPPDCPHVEILALWAEVLPAMPQHLPSMWRGARADHLRARWRETAVEKGWTDQQQGLDFLRRLFGYVGQSKFLTGRCRPSDPGRSPFVAELEWIVNPTNWAKLIEGKYHQEAA